MPKVSPDSMCRLTSRSAQSCRFGGRLRLRIVSLSDRFLTSLISKTRPRSLAAISPGASSRGGMSDLCGEAVLIPLDDPQAEQGSQRAHDRAIEEQGNAGH